jgi:hypothetical protein
VNVDALAADPSAWAPALKERRRQMGLPTVTGLVHTLNEERMIVDALRSLAWVDELIVVDMHSDDRTVALAEQEGARVCFFPRSDIVEPARQFGFDQASCDWTIVVDADERVTHTLAEQLTALTLRPEIDIVQVPYANSLCGAYLRGTGWGDEYHPRFFRTGSVRWPAVVHSSPELNGNVAIMRREPENQMLHLNYRDLEHFFEKMNRYTAKEAEKLEAAGGDPSWEAAAEAARYQVEWRWTPELDGARSAALSVSMAIYLLLAHSKRWEALGWPDAGAPADARTALRSLASDAPARHRAALERHAAGDAPGAVEDMRAAVQRELDPEILNDLAVVLHAAGRSADAKALLQGALAIDPGNADARANLDAVEAA